MRQYYDIVDELEPRKRYVLNYAYRNGMAGYWKSMTFDADDRRQLIRDVYKLIPKGTVDTPTQTTMVRSFDKIIADMKDLLTEALNLSKDAAIMEGKSVGYDKINALITDLEAVPEKIYNDFQQKALFPAEEYSRIQQEGANNVARKTAETKKWSMLNYKDSYPNVNYDCKITIDEKIID